MWTQRVLQSWPFPPFWEAPSLPEPEASPQVDADQVLADEMAPSWSWRRTMAACVTWALATRGNGLFLTAGADMSLGSGDPHHFPPTLREVIGNGFSTLSEKQFICQETIWKASRTGIWFLLSHLSLPLVASVPMAG